MSFPQMTYGRALKPRACRTCRKQFSPRNSFMTCCSPLCAIADAKTHTNSLERAARRATKALHAQERKMTRLALAKLETSSDHVKKAQKAVNAYVRVRDKGLPCISCGRPDDGTKRDAGHYRSTGAAPHLRFMCKQIRAQCVKCNQHLSGNLIGYRKGLINLIGLNAVEEIENDNQPRKLSIPQIQAITEHYKALTKGLT